LATREPTGSPQQISAAIEEISARAQVIVREEIELAKTEVTLKVQRLVKGLVVGIVAGFFAIGALLLLLDGFAWLAWWALPVNSSQIFWGFFLVAVILLILGAIAGWVAARFFKAGAPPTPELAIEEAQRIRETVQSS
jgi:tetrahydromethanopterin S-methyltransferase subunit F